MYLLYRYGNRGIFPPSLLPKGLHEPARLFFMLLIYEHSRAHCCGDFWGAGKPLSLSLEVLCAVSCFV